MKHRFIAGERSGVYLPFSYTIGGNSVIISPEYVDPYKQQ
jgi:hypothetical protein